MRLADFLDKGASLSLANAPCLTMAGQTRSYAAVQRLSWLVGRALARSGIRPGDNVAVLPGSDPLAFACVFGISRAGAVWCPVGPRDRACENRELLELLGCRALIFGPESGPGVAKIAPGLPGLATLICLDSGDADGGVPGAVGFGEWVAGLPDDPWQAGQVDDVVVMAATAGGAGAPGCTRLTGSDVEALADRTLKSYPAAARPVYQAPAPLSHQAAMECLPVMALGGEVVITPLETIIAGSLTVRPDQVERALLAHPAVLDCAVVGLPDDQWGERVAAVIQVRSGQRVALDEIARLVRDALTGVTAPKRVEIWPDLPRSEAGQVLRLEVKRALLAPP
jgi:acyl-coenzyme A synthetase/AMP-(fatty) acid ligase